MILTSLTSKIRATIKLIVGYVFMPPGNPKLEEDDDTAPGVPNELRCFETFSSDNRLGILKESPLVRDGIFVNDKSVSKHFLNAVHCTFELHFESASEVTINMRRVVGDLLGEGLYKYNSTTRNSFWNYGIWWRD